MRHDRRSEIESVSWRKSISNYLFIFSCLIMYLSYDISRFKSMSSPGSFPMIVSFILFISSIFVLNEVRVKQASHGTKEEDNSSEASTDLSIVHYLFPRLFVIFFIASLIYVFLIVYLSFIYASIIFLFFTGVYFKSEKFKLDTKETIKIGIISILTVVIVYLIFHNIFKVILP